MTLKEGLYLDCGPTNTRSLVRTRARAITKNIKECSLCGYSKHVETHHIKPVASFSEDTLISIINSPKNLCVLCPNCHWEVEHGITKL